MGKLIKIVILLAVVAGGIALAVHYADKKSDKSAGDQPRTERGTKMQPQEKYGFAPIGDDE